MTTETKSTEELIDRYLGRSWQDPQDARFRHLVDMMVAYMMDNKVSPDEVRDAAFVASLKFLQMNPVRRLIYERDDIRWPTDGIRTDL